MDGTRSDTTTSMLCGMRSLKELAGGRGSHQVKDVR